MDALGVMRPDETPHATAYVDRMVELVADLVARGVAYETGDGVYLSVMDVPGYGLLARQPLDSLRAGARVEADEEKRSPLDFVLWKKAKPGEPSWESPWGPGRPGWHTECVVMSLDLLGDGFDLHGGAIDLIFPHHENERAQAVAAGRTFARHWVHNGWVTMDGEKMSKSLGNFTSLEDLLERSDARGLPVAGPALALPVTHRSDPRARSPTPRPGWPASTSWPAGSTCVDPLAEGPVVDGATGAGRLDEEAVARFRQAMDDDLDTPGALAAVFDLVRRANNAADAGRPDGAATTARRSFLCAALGLPLRPGAVDEIDAASAALVHRRDAARAARDWAEADSLRGQLESAGWVVEDGPDGTRIRRRPAAGPLNERYARRPGGSSAC